MSRVVALFITLIAWLPSAHAETLKVVATTSMIADAAQVLGGDAVEVHGLMGPGIDPHSYRQTRTDIVAMAQADLVLWHGLFLEAQMEPFLLELGEKTQVLAVTETVPRAELLSHADYEGRYDPHIWMAPRLWVEVVTRIERALIEARPELAERFAANADAYRAEIIALEASARATLDTVPDGARILVTAHDAFAYFGRDYGFEVEGIQGLSTASEAGLARIRELVELLVERNVGAVFVESSVSDRNIRALIEGAAAAGHEVVIGGELYSDAMGPEGTAAGTYLGMIEHNVELIADALGGTKPLAARSRQLE